MVVEKSTSGFNSETCNRTGTILGSGFAAEFDSTWDKKTKYFQVTVTIRKRQNFIWKVMDEHGLWSKDQNVILQIFSNEFYRRFKKDPNAMPSKDISLSRDITSLDNEC